MSHCLYFSALFAIGFNYKKYSFPQEPTTTDSPQPPEDQDGGATEEVPADENVDLGLPTKKKKKKKKVDFDQIDVDLPVEDGIIVL